MHNHGPGYFLKGSMVVIAASVPIYLGSAWLIATLLPEYAFLAMIPLAFGLHSGGVLLLQYLSRLARPPAPSDSEEDYDSREHY